MAGEWFPGHHLQERAEKTALILASQGESMTYAEVDGFANQLARLLRGRGLRPGDHVSLWFENELMYPAVWWGAHYAGLRYTLISSRLTPSEAAYIVRDSGSALALVGHDIHAANGSAIAELLGDDVEIIVADSSETGLVARLSMHSPAPMPDAVEGAAMLYSSGTTGQPKGVKRQLSGQPLGTSPGGALFATRVFGLESDSIYLSPAPLYHAAPFAWVSSTLSIGATAVVMEHFEPLAFLAAIERHRVTHTQLVPTMFVRLLALPEEDRGRFDLSSLRCAIHAAAPCPVATKEQMFDWWGPIIHEYYGGTEGIGITYCSPADWLTHKGSVGRPLLGEVHIVDDVGVELPPGVVGNVYFAGTAPFEYHNAPSKTDESFLPNGWATYGDVGHIDDDGFLYLTDRRAYTIIVGGVNVYPQEAENVLIDHPSVLDAAVFGVPDDEWGEQVMAVVQLVDPAQEAGMEALLLDHLRERLASVKCPRRIDFRSRLPREPNGKLLKRTIREEYLADRLEV